MSNLDIANDIKITYLSQLDNVVEGTSFGLPLDTRAYDGGYFLSAIVSGTNGGTHTFTLQESVVGGGPHTDVPANKLIDPGGNGEIVLTGLTPIGPLQKLGSFSTKRFIRFKIVTVGPATSSQILIVATRNPENKPDLSDTI